jgi:PilZ domain
LEVISVAAEHSATSGPNRRITRRRRLKQSVEITVRKGAMGLGPNLAADGVELSADGVQLEVTVPLKKGDEIEIGLTGVGRSRPIHRMADVRWCQLDPGGKTFYIGASFRRRLTHAEIAEYV